MIIVLLAAGQGKRLKKSLPKSFSYKTKSLVPVNNEPAIKRLVNQFLKINQNNILLVLGHEHESILEVFNSKKQPFVLNKNYEKDSNLKSLFLAFKSILNDQVFDIDKGVLVIETDSVFSNESLEKYIKYIDGLLSLEQKNNKICWTTKGLANIKDTGGFIDPQKNIKNLDFGEINDVYIKNKPNNKKTLKMFGMTWFDKFSMINWYDNCKELLDGKNSYDNTGYFHEIIFKNLNKYSMYYYDLGPKALSFNNFLEYSKCLDFN